MTHDLRSLFPHISADCLGRNSGGSGSATQLERHPVDGALEPITVQGEHPALFLVRITSVRVRLIDEDNLCEKYHLDCCRYAGLIPDDSPDKVRLETRQRKTRPGEAEHTQIEIYRLKPDQPTQQQLPLQ